MIILYLAILIACLLVCLMFLCFFVFTVYASFVTDAPFVEVPKETLEKTVKSLSLSENSVLFDLGCGDARVLVEAVKSKPSIKAVGVELSLVPYLLSKFRTRKYPQIKIKRENFFSSDISSATHFFLYLYPKIVSKLIFKIEKECKPGTRIVSCDFQISERTPSEIIDLSVVNPNSVRGKKLYVYII